MEGRVVRVCTTHSGALSDTTALKKTVGRIYFRVQVPRMRTFNPIMGVMGSKGSSRSLKRMSRQTRDGARSSGKRSILGGAFLVKPRSEGDLRRDASDAGPEQCNQSSHGFINESKGKILGTANTSTFVWSHYRTQVLADGFRRSPPKLVCEIVQPQASPHSSKQRIALRTLVTDAAQCCAESAKKCAEAWKPDEGRCSL
jgi:hypothetical protein